MKNLITVILILSIKTSFSQVSGGEWCATNKQRAFTEMNKKARLAYPGDNQIDVNFHKIDLKIDFDKKYIIGVVSTTFSANASISTCFFDLTTALKVDSIKSENQKLSYTHLNNKIEIQLGKTIILNEKYNLKIYYQGFPPTTSFGSFSFSTHGTAKSPVVWSLSQPYGAPNWWPCKDDLLDKVDSSEVWITLPSSFVSVSNGTLKETATNQDGTKTYKWKNSYPIAHYLISIACSNYSTYNSEFDYKGKKMPIENYIYPEVLTAANKTQLDKTAEMLKFFTDTFGEYPFIKEKYGHAMCNFGGGMEHQTISSMGSFSESLIAHELAHQWFGDKITCKTWADIFVNEAFASYSEALFDEFKYGKERYLATINGHVVRAKKTTESVYISKPENENLIFDYSLTYGKGAVVLHMLRGVLGDNLFFKSLKDYMASAFSYKAASIDDFRKIAEVTSSKDLKYFFDEWIYGTNYPKFTFSWANIGSNSIKLSIDQQKLSTTPNLFKMPIQLKISFENGKDSLISVFVDNLSNTYTIEKLSSKVSKIIFDPSSYIMKELIESNLVTANKPTILSNFVFPNPANEYLEYQIFEQNIKQIQIYNLEGKLLKKFITEEAKLGLNNLSSGKYIIKLFSSTGTTTKLFVKK